MRYYIVFQCDQCGKTFKNLGGLNSHKNYCAILQSRKNKPDPNEVIQCNICGQLLTRKFLDLHFKTKHDTTYTRISNEFVCKFCGKTYRDAGNLKKHIMYSCNNNPDKTILKKKKSHSEVWNKGKTKETDERVYKQSASLKESYSSGRVIPPFKGKHHSDFSKKLQSDAQLALDHSNNCRRTHGKGGYIDGIYMMSRYELAYYVYMRDTHQDIRRCDKTFTYEYEGKKHHYTPDFIVNNRVVEIKGFETPVDIIKYAAVENLQVLYLDDIQHCFTYCKEKYNVEDVAQLYDTKR